MDLQAELERLQRKNAELEMRVQGLAWACQDLKDICAAHGVPFEELKHLLGDQRLVVGRAGAALIRRRGRVAGKMTGE